MERYWLNLFLSLPKKLFIELKALPFQTHLHFHCFFPFRPRKLKGFLAPVSYSSFPSILLPFVPFQRESFLPPLLFGAGTLCCFIVGSIHYRRRMDDPFSGDLSFHEFFFSLPPPPQVNAYSWRSSPYPTQIFSLFGPPQEVRFCLANSERSLGRTALISKFPSQLSDPPVSLNS